MTILYILDHNGYIEMFKCQVKHVKIGHIAKTFNAFIGDLSVLPAGPVTDSQGPLEAARNTVHL